MRSIRYFLLIGLFSILLLSFFVIYLLNRYVTLQEIGEIYDTQLVQTSRILEGFVDRPSSEIDFQHLNNALLTATQNYKENEFRNNEGHEYEHKFAIQLWDNNNKLLVKSPTAPLNILSNLVDGYSIQQYGGFDWHVFTHQITSNGYWIVVAERADVRGDLIHKIEIAALTGPIAAMILLAIGVITIVTRGLKPLTLLSQQISERNIDNLEPLQLIHTSTELKPLINAINFLMQHVYQEVERERRFLGDIAHELRTPLAALKLNAQHGLQTKDVNQTQHTLIKIVQGVDRSTRLIEQLLTLARLDPRALGSRENCVIGDIVQDVVNQQKLHAGNTKTVTFSVANSLFNAQLFVYPVLMNVLIRNLIENAYRYSPEDGCIAIDGEINTAGNFLLRVKDEGNGVSETQLRSLGKRFYQEHPADRMSTGLGLSIVARIAELHHAKVNFANVTPHGLMVTLEFHDAATLE